MKLVIVIVLILEVLVSALAAPSFPSLSEILAGISVLNNNNQNAYASCNLQVKDFTYKQPLLLNGLNLWKQTGPNLNFTGKITLACTGGRNVLDGTQERLAQATCSGQKLRYAGKSVPAGSVVCKNSITGDVASTAERCASGRGQWSRLGFDLRNGTFIELYRVCYSQEKADALYSHHRVFGRSVPFKQIEPRRPEFKSAGSAPNVSLANAYKGATQLETFTTLLGEDQAKLYINTTKGSILARGHLSPDADFPLVPLQFATYFYVNVCPQWQTVNAGNWLKVETMVRQLASRRKDDFEIYTGVHDVLTLPDLNGNPREIYLSDDMKITVPKWLWKVVYHQRKKEGIALVTLNNPYAQRSPRTLCRDICSEHNWDNDVFAVLPKGFTYCCDITELRQVVSMVPSLNVKKLLQFPDK